MKKEEAQGDDSISLGYINYEERRFIEKIRSNQ